MALSFWKKNKDTGAATAATQPSQPVKTGQFILPTGTTKDDFRDGYPGTIYNPQGSCPDCNGGGLEPKADGTYKLCHCTRGDDQMLRQPSTTGLST